MQVLEHPSYRPDLAPWEPNSIPLFARYRAGTSSCNYGGLEDSFERRPEGCISPGSF